MGLPEESSAEEDGLRGRRKILIYHTYIYIPKYTYTYTDTNIATGQSFSNKK